MEGIEYIEDRHMDKGKMLRFATCRYVDEGWYDRINADPNNDSPISDAIIDRIVNTAYAKDQNECSAHFIRTIVLKEIMLSEINKLLHTVHDNEDEFIKLAMLWLRDDEDSEHFNAFQVYCFKNGKRYLQEDTMLSPCVPEIEGASF